MCPALPCSQCHRLGFSDRLSSCLVCCGTRLGRIVMSISDTCSQPAASFQMLPVMMMMMQVGGQVILLQYTIVLYSIHVCFIPGM